MTSKKSIDEEFESIRVQRNAFAEDQLKAKVKQFGEDFKGYVCKTPVIDNESDEQTFEEIHADTLMVEYNDGIHALLYGFRGGKK
jgi:hypothetical protein